MKLLIQSAQKSCKHRFDPVRFAWLTSHLPSNVISRAIWGRGSGEWKLLESKLRAPRCRVEVYYASITEYPRAESVEDWYRNDWRMIFAACSMMAYWFRRKLRESGLNLTYNSVIVDSCEFHSWFWPLHAHDHQHPFGAHEPRYASSSCTAQRVLPQNLTTNTFHYILNTVHVIKTITLIETSCVRSLLKRCSISKKYTVKLVPVVVPVVVAVAVVVPKI